VVAAVILVAEGGLFYWLIRRRKGIFRPSLVTGLPWRERRTVVQAVRHGRPPWVRYACAVSAIVLLGHSAITEW